ncbi:hypothetical protein C2S51_032758 [Perilla frutescens var. frutescens]|nr:hypothetical protein C2S51_032758 [Perilla frutescens var. frutescens]
MEKIEAKKQKPHCLILPFPIQGHINPMIQFSKRLADKGITITLAATKDLLNSTADDFSGLISVGTISDGYDEGKAGVELPPYLEKFQQVGSQTLSRLIESLRASGRSVDCLIYDAFLPWGLAVAKNCGVSGAAFFTQSCCVNIIYYNIYKGVLRVPVLEEEILIPGLPKLDASDLPSFVLDQEKHPGSFELLATDWLRKFMSVKTIGPTIPSMFLDKRLAEDKNYGLSIFKADDTCMKWLEQRSPKSVIYVSFGSMAQLEEQQMEELAISLKLTNKHFLWVVRSSEESKLPKDFADETSEKGLIVSWCPQLEVLAHEAIGCFLTHSGWNSTLEALSLGVPMVGVPWWSDQSTNAKFVMDSWKMGIRARPDEENIVRRGEIVGCVKYVMEGEGGEEIRNNARKWKELARGAVDEGGSSDTNIQEFVSTLIMRLGN